MKKLFLIDGNSFCYRAFYAIRDLSTSKGQPTNAIYGFVAMLKKIISQECPDYLAVSFDLKGPTFRHKRFQDYKIHRKPMPDTLVEQMPVIKEIIRAYGIPIFEKEGFEADDLLATLARRMGGKGIDVYIVTGDKDILQLVNSHIKVYSPHKEAFIYDEAKVIERYGVGPDKIIELMSLMGDPTDNIPGVPGIGEKTASRLIKEFGSLENLLLNLEMLKKESLKKAIKENEDKARLSRELATVDCEVPIDIRLEQMKLARPDKHKLYGLFKELEFRALLEEFAPESMEASKSDYGLILTKEQFEPLLEGLKRSGEFAFDLETTGPDPITAEPVGVSFCWQGGEAYYVPVRHKNHKHLKFDYVFGRLKPIIEDEQIKKIGQNVKYEKVVLSNFGIDLKGIAFDTMVASYLLNPSKPNHNLDSIALELLDYKKIPIQELIGKGKSRIGMDEADLQRLCQYACEDSDITFRLKEVLEGRLMDMGLYDLFCKVELPLIEVLGSMELAGVAVDKQLLKEMSNELSKQLDRLTSQIYEMAESEFNINSPKQLSFILFEKLGLPVIKRTKTGVSTDEEVLEKLASKHALPAAILEYRQLAKLKSTYVDSLPELINKKTGKVHTSFNQTVAATGRLSSSHPNLQNIPIRTEIGRQIRRAFVGSEDDFYLLSADYSQIELRILAHFSGDENLIEAFEKDADIHTHTASLVFGVKEDEVTPQMRSTAKTVNFGIIYGMSSYGLSRDLEIGPGQAKEFIDSYFERYPRVKEYMEGVIQDAGSRGYVTTLMQRRRFLPEINSPNNNLRQFAQRTAINTPIQGSAADLIKAAMINIYRELNKRGLRTRMILQVHDELVFDVPAKELKEVTELVGSEMEGVIKLKVPIKTSIKTGKNWLDQKPCLT